MTPPFAGQPGHGGTAFVRNQPARIADGRNQGGYTGVYELICPSCGDHPYLDYSELPPRLQRLRGPRTLEAALTAYHQHLGIPGADENEAGSLGLDRRHRRVPRSDATSFRVGCDCRRCFRWPGWRGTPG
jgi:hypothetical protein